MATTSEENILEEIQEDYCEDPSRPIPTFYHRALSEIKQEKKFGFSFVKSKKIEESSEGCLICLDEENDLIYSIDRFTGLLQVLNLFTLQVEKTFVVDPQIENLQAIITSIVFSKFDSTLVVCVMTNESYEERKSVVRKLTIMGELIWSTSPVTGYFVGRGVTVNDEDGTIYDFEIRHFRVLNSKGEILSEKSEFTKSELLDSNGRNTWSLNPHFIANRIYLSNSGNEIAFVYTKHPSSTSNGKLKISYDNLIMSYDIKSLKDSSSITVDKEKRLLFTAVSDCHIICVNDLLQPASSSSVHRFAIPFFDMENCRMVTSSKHCLLIIADINSYIHIVKYGMFTLEETSQNRGKFYELARERCFYKEEERLKVGRSVVGWQNTFKSHFNENLSKSREKLFSNELQYYGRLKSTYPVDENEKKLLEKLMSEREEKISRVGDNLIVIEKDFQMN